MKALKKHPRLLYALLLCVFLCFHANANTLPHCKELISKGIDAMSKKDYVKSLELLTEARALAEKNNWHEQLFLANNNIGNTYYSMLDYGEAINYYLEAYNIALKELEPVNEMVVLNNIAILYSKENNQTRAREYFKKAYDIAKQNNDRVKIGMYALNLGNLSNEINQPNEARKYILEALPYLKGQTYLLLQAETTLAENELLLGFPKKAREKAQNILLNGGDTTYNDTAISLLLIIARSYLAENNFPEAITYANKVLAKNVNLETKFSAFRLLSDIYAKSNRLETALAYKDSLLTTQQKLNEIKNGRQFENNRVKFEIQNYKNEIAVKEEKLEAERKLFYYIIAVIIAVVTIIILSLRNMSARHKQKKLIAERNQQAIALELEKEKTENLLLEKQLIEKEANSLLEQERLKNEIEARNQKLSARALYHSGRNQLIEDVIADLSQLPAISSDKQLAGHIKALKNHLSNDDEWDTFITHFEEVNHGLINKLKSLHPSLTANDIRFISYVYMNLSSKEIAALLNITAEACRKRKERIAAKMELPESISLYDYLSTL